MADLEKTVQITAEQIIAEKIIFLFLKIFQYSL